MPSELTNNVVLEESCEFILEIFCSQCSFKGDINIIVLNDDAISNEINVFPIPQGNVKTALLCCLK